MMKGDTISRSALIAEIKKWTTDCACIELIENEPAVDAAPEWISVKDGLPEFGDTIVIRFGDKTDIATYWRGEVCPHWRGQWYGTIDLGSVTHWMPLPEPPEEKEK